MTDTGMYGRACAPPSPLLTKDGHWAYFTIKLNDVSSKHPPPSALFYGIPVTKFSTFRITGGKHINLEMHSIQNSKRWP